MTATMVRKNAQGADGSGVSLPATTNATRDSAVSNEQSASKCERYPMASHIGPSALTSTAGIRYTTPGPDASGARSTRQTRRRAQSSAPPSTKAPTSLPLVKKESNGDSITTSTASQDQKSEIMQPPTAPALAPMQPNEPPKIETAEAPSAAGGKKRGRNGRYLTKDDDHVSDDGEQLKPVKKGNYIL